MEERYAMMMCCSVVAKFRHGSSKETAAIVDEGDAPWH
jgi:hypothetical protein